MRNVLRSARHILAMDAFANTSTLSFFQAYHNENIHIINNNYQSHISESLRLSGET